MIKLENVSFAYKKGLDILTDINLEIKEGEITMIIGKNGSGKSTLLKVIANLVKYKGNILLDNQDYKKIKDLDFRRQVGMVFQNPSNQIVLPKVYDDMQFTLSNLKLDNHDYLIKNSLTLVGMLDYQDKNPYELSLGEKQRINLANIIAINPKFILLDEITSMIDHEGKLAIYKIIKDLKQKGLGFIFGTNMIDEVLYADKIVLLKDKKVYKVLTRKELLNNLDILNEVDIPLSFILQIIKKRGIPNNIDNIESYLLKNINYE